MSTFLRRAIRSSCVARLVVPRLPPSGASNRRFVILSKASYSPAEQPWASPSRYLQTCCALFAKGQPVKMPSLSPTMSEGTIVKWYKKEGESFKPGDVLCDIQTDKAVVSFEMEEEGVLAKILKPENSKDVKVGTLIAVTVEEGEDWKSVEVPDVASEAPAGASEASSGPAPAATPAAAAASSGGAGLDHHSLSGVGPAVRNLLQMYNIGSEAVQASGPGGRLTKGDVLQYVQSKGLKPAPVAEEKPPAQPKKAAAGAPSSSAPAAAGASPFVDIPLSSMRATIAKRLTESKLTIPHAYATVEADITDLLAERKRLKSLGVKVSVNDFVVKAVAEALMRCPNVNVLYKDGQIQWQRSVDISVAVATDQGLITPIVFRASKKSVEAISAEVKDLAGRAKANKLKLEEFQGGSFTISNLGMFGILEFTAIINLPQCAILAVGGGSSVLGADGKFREMMRSSLSYDARAISETDAAEFLEIYQTCLETPSLLLRGSAGSSRRNAAELYAN